jgi:putative membrane protein
MIRTMTMAACAAALLAAAGCNKGNRSTSGTSGSSGSRTYGTTEPSTGREVGSDTAFLQDAAMGGRAEVELSNLAQRQANRQEVRDFAQQMVTDHTALNNRVTELASTRGVTLPSQPDTKHRDLLDKLMNMQGADFDNQYIRAMIDDHEQTIRKFEHEAQYGTDPQTRALAQQALPTIRHHLDMAKGLQTGAGMQGMQGDMSGQPSRTQPQQPTSTPPTSTPRNYPPGNTPSPDQTPGSNPK